MKQDAVKAGAAIGAIAGGGKGAAVGGGARTGAVLATRGKEVKFSPEDRLKFSLNEDLWVQIQ